jgi:hypothetical protein
MKSNVCFEYRVDLSLPVTGQQTVCEEAWVELLINRETIQGICSPQDQVDLNRLFTCSGYASFTGVAAYIPVLICVRVVPCSGLPAEVSRPFQEDIGMYTEEEDTVVSSSFSSRLFRSYLVLRR